MELSVFPGHIRVKQSGWLVGLSNLFNKQLCDQVPWPQVFLGVLPDPRCSQSKTSTGLSGGKTKASSPGKKRQPKLKTVLPLL